MSEIKGFDKGYAEGHDQGYEEGQDYTPHYVEDTSAEFKAKYEETNPLKD